eukprot:2611045-Pleurochrysis_carterae.AAC.1
MFDPLCDITWASIQWMEPSAASKGYFCIKDQQGLDHRHQRPAGTREGDADVGAAVPDGVA